MIKKIVSCFECDSEYTIVYEDGLVSDEPQYCVVCKEEVTSEEVIEDDEELEE